MTIETVTQADREMAAAFVRMTEAHAQLAIPESEDVAVDWREVLAQIDEYGEAALALMLLARDSLLPNLKAVKIQVQATLTEIDLLNYLAQATPNA